MTRVGLVGVVVSPLAALAERAPRAALLLCDVIALLSVPFRRAHRRQLRRMFPQLSETASRRLLVKLLRDDLRNHVLSWMVFVRRSSGVTRFLGVAGRLRCVEGPLLGVTVHTGAVQATGAVRSTDARIHVVLRANGVTARARHFLTALRQLNAGDVVLMATDTGTEAQITAPFLDGSLMLARGAFALARLSGAPILPFLLVWRRGRIEVIEGPLIACARGADETDDDFERRLAAAFCRWLGEHLRANPRDLGLAVLDRFAEAH